MALVIRIVSADGKKVFSRVLPALPSHIKIPPGAKIEVIDQATKMKYSLPQYINLHSDDAAKMDGSPALPKVTIENVATWAEAQDYLDSLGTVPPGETTTDRGPWYDDPGEEREGEVLGLSQNTLLIGGLVGGGLAAGAFLLGGGGSNTPRDTIAPVAPTGLDLATADDTGASSTDNITTVAQGLTFTGTAEAGSRVELFNGTTKLGETTATATGTFSLDIDLADGIYSVTAVATDTAGNRSAASTALPVRVDTIAPGSSTALDLDPEDDSGRSNTDNITSANTGITINGTVDAPAIVELYDGPTRIATVNVAQAGVWETDVTLAPGTHALTARTIDTAGNAGNTTDILNVVVDTARPSAPAMPDLAANDDTGTSNTDNITGKQTALTFSGTVEAGATVELFNGGTSLGTASVDAAGNWQRDLDLAPNEYLIRVRATDAAGNVSDFSPALELSVTAQPAGLFVENPTFG